MSVVLTLCRVSPDYLVPMTRSLLPVEIEQEEEQELTASAQALLDLDTEAPPAVGKKAQAPGKTQRHRFRWIWILGLFAVLAAGTGGGLFAWWKLSPQTFQQTCQKLPPNVRGLCKR